MKKKGITLSMISMITGVFTGMLIAPKEGKELRKDIKEKAINVKNKGAKDTLKEELKKVETEIEKITDKKMKPLMKEKTNDLMEKLEEIIKVAKNKKDKVIEKSARVLKDRLKDMTDIKN